MLSALLATVTLAAAHIGPVGTRAPRIATPPEAFSSAPSGVGYLDLLIAPDGRVANCATRLGDGRTLRDRSACYPLLRIRAVPATVDGQPAYGTVQLRFAWQVSTDGDRTKVTQPDLSAADMTLTVKALPEALGTSARTSADALVAADGKVEACTVAVSSGSPPLDRAACDAINGSALRVETDARGQTVRSVQPVVVDFVEAGR